MGNELEKNNSETKESHVKETALDLKTAREARGITLDEMAQVTRISISNLEAIENGEFHLLPEPVYARAFIGTYAKTAGVDGAEILSRYTKYLEDVKSKEQLKDLRKQSWLRSHLGLFIWGLALFCVASFFVFSYFYGDYAKKRDVGQSPIVKTTEDVLKDKEALVTEEKAEALPSETETLAVDDSEKTERDMIEEETVTYVPESEKEPLENAGTEAESYRLIIEATEWTWLEIKKDGDLPFEVLMKPGEKIVRDSSEKFSLIVGNAGGVNIEFDGKPLGPLGKHGEVILLTLPRDVADD
jgi:cytoskeleton protein RodZ